MKAKQYLFRVTIIILGVVSFHILGIELLIVFVMAPTFREFLTILSSPLPVAIPVVIVYMIITSYYLGPVWRFLSDTAAGIPPSPDLVRTAENRCVNQSYFLSALSFPAYILGGTFGVGLMTRALGWPAHVMIYGLLGGIIAGLLTIPMAEHFSAWAVRPVLDMILSRDDDRKHSRSAGFPVSLRSKFVIIVVAMVIGITGYTAIISYNLTNKIIENTAQIETMLPKESARLLAAESFGTADTRIKSHDYFRSRMGGFNLFFIAIMTISGLFSLVVSLVAAAAITRPLKILGLVTENIQTGEHNEDIRIIANDEFAHMGASINRMTGTLFSQLRQNQSLIESIREAVDTLSPMLSQLVAIADHQAESGKIQETATNEAAATGRELADVARQIAENTARMTRSSEKTREITREGQQRLLQTETALAEISARMKDIVASMNQLERQSQEIDEMVQTIKEISGKTNILSINAGIEAIKAGSDGVRFGVVAREIRLLAHDSRQSAIYITGNIERIREALETSVTYVENGEHTVAAGKEAMAQMTEHFERILNANMTAATDLEQIETITFHQADANRQLSGIINQLKKGTQATAAAAGKTHTTLKSLERLVMQLQSHTQRDT